MYHIIDTRHFEKYNRRSRRTPDVVRVGELRFLVVASLDSALAIRQKKQGVKKWLVVSGVKASHVGHS